MFIICKVKVTFFLIFVPFPEILFVEIISIKPNTDQLIWYLFC